MADLELVIVAILFRIILGAILATFWNLVLMVLVDIFVFAYPFADLRPHRSMALNVALYGSIAIAAACVIYETPFRVTVVR